MIFLLMHYCNCFSCIVSENIDTILVKNPNFYFFHPSVFNVYDGDDHVVISTRDVWCDKTTIVSVLYKIFDGLMIRFFLFLLSSLL